MLYARYLYQNDGLQHHKDDCAKVGLKVGKRYLVWEVEMGQSNTSIVLDGIVGRFDSVFFKFEEENFAPKNIYTDQYYNHYMMTDKLQRKS